MALYTLERALTKTGEPKERELRRKGHRVRIDYLMVGSPLVAYYVDDMNQRLMTSMVEAHSGDGLGSDHLTIQTSNSVYSFRKIKEDD